MLRLKYLRNEEVTSWKVSEQWIGSEVNGFLKMLRLNHLEDFEVFY